jgi:RNA polymerase sigma-32 factor
MGLERETSLSIYLSQIAKHPVLPVDEERALARRFRSGDLEAGRKLVTANLRFVVRIANEYRGYGLRVADLIQEGNLGLIKGVEKFDPHREIRLISYAVWWVRAYIQNHIVRSWSLVKVGTTQTQRRLFFSLAKARRELERDGREAAESDRVQALAEALHARPEEIAEMEGRMSGRDVSLDAPVETDGPPRGDLVPSQEKAADDRVSETEITQLLSGRVAKALRQLDPRERFIVQKRVFDESPATFQDLGEHFGVSRERARQLELRAFQKLRRLLGAEVELARAA